MANTTYPKRRRFIRIFESVNNTIIVINYFADNNELNTFLHHFDAWNSNGEFKLSPRMECESTENYQEVWFEMPIDFMDFAKSDLFKLVMNRFNVEILYENNTILKGIKHG